MTVNLLTIPHTGTMWTHTLLLAHMGLSMRFQHITRNDAARRWVEVQNLPCVVTLTDPVLAWISGQNRDQPQMAANGLREWDMVAQWDGRENVHFLHVDCLPERRDDEIERLCAFLGASVQVPVDWTPRNTSEDVTGMKAAYLRGDPTPETLAVMDRLAASQPVANLFATRRASYPWLEASWR